MFSGSANGYKRFGRPQLFGRFYALSKAKLFLIFGVGWCVMPVGMIWVCLLCCSGVYGWPATNMFFREDKFQHNSVVARANSLWSDFLLCLLLCFISNHLWPAPPSGVVKINVDVAVIEYLPYFGVGVVARSNLGVVLFAMACRLPGKFSPHLAEIHAVRAGVLSALGS